jgi:hydrogenase/urease accessory protein HupE
MIARRGAVLIVITALLNIGAAEAHEVRPAMLEIRQTGPSDYSVMWKRPMMGDIGVHLVPHLSTGWLDQPSRDRYAAGSFLIESWSVTDAPPRALDHASLWIEGLRGTLTDVFVRASFQDGHQIETIVRAESPQFLFAGPQAEGEVHWQFLKLGVHHILTGPDHLLFVFGLLMMASWGWPLIKAITGFTLAHSFTLAIATLWRVNLPVPMMNMLVALSILFLACELIRARAGGTSIALRKPMIPAFAFGLLHGLAFATDLSSLDLTGAELLGALLEFNVGVEIGQLAFVGALIALSRVIHLLPMGWPRVVKLIPAYALGIVSSAWLFQYGVAVLERQ